MVSKRCKRRNSRVHLFDFPGMADGKKEGNLVFMSYFGPTSPGGTGMQYLLDSMLFSH